MPTRLASSAMRNGRVKFFFSQLMAPAIRLLGVSLIAI